MVQRPCYKGCTTHVASLSHCRHGGTGNTAYPVYDGDSVVEAEGEEERPTEGDAGEQDVPDPLPALHLGVVGGCRIPAHTGCQGVQNNERREEAAPVVGVEHPHARQNEDEDGQGEQLQHGTCRVRAWQLVSLKLVWARAHSLSQHMTGSVPA